MKKVLLATVVLAGSMAFMSCKKEYTCCFYEDGAVVSEALCTTVKMKKKDAEAAHTDYGAGSTFECKK